MINKNTIGFQVNFIVIAYLIHGFCRADSGSRDFDHTEWAECGSIPTYSTADLSLILQGHIPLVTCIKNMRRAY